MAFQIRIRRTVGDAWLTVAVAAGGEAAEKHREVQEAFQKREFVLEMVKILRKSLPGFHVAAFEGESQIVE